MTKPVDKILDELAALRDLRKQGVLSQNLYHKTLVDLASQCFDVEAVDDALVVLLGIPVAYYKDVLPDQMVEDEGFAFRASRVARRLILHGLVSEDQLPVVLTQKGPAQA